MELGVLWGTQMSSNTGTDESTYIGWAQCSVRESLVFLWQDLTSVGGGRAARKGFPDGVTMALRTKG